MAVVTVKSGAITNYTASPKVPISPGLHNGNIRGSRALVAIANGDSVASRYQLWPIRSSDFLPYSITYTAADIGTTTAFDLGLYRTADDGGAVVDADFFASAVALNAGPYNHVEICTEAGAAGGNVTNGEKRVWEALGLTADPFLTYIVEATLTGAADAAGSVLFKSLTNQGE
jgi:hypothetical protein